MGSTRNGSLNQTKVEFKIRSRQLQAGPRTISGSSMTLLKTRKRTFRLRGIARRELLLSAARTLLDERDLDEISLGDVAARAGVPKGSAYHFYDDIKDLYAALLALTEEEVLKIHGMPITEPVRHWPDVVRILIRRGVAFYNSDRPSCQLQIGPKTPPELKLHDRRSDLALASLYQQHINTLFELPELPDAAQVFFRAVEIADLMFGLSVLETGRITAAMGAEAERATVAYLGTYLPAKLRRRRRPLVVDLPH
jgi:AcrR family transcriptional regulator